MIEAAAAIVPGPVGRAIAPPGVEPRGRGMEIAAEIDPRIAGPERIQRIDFHGRVADDLEQLLVAPDVAGKRRDIEIPDEQGGQGERLGPARHPLDEIERSEEHTSELQSLMRISYAVF